MTDRSDWFRTQEELRAPTDEECRVITERATQAARDQFNVAATAMSIAKIKSGDRTPWRDLVEAHRKTLPFRMEVEVVSNDGIPRVQVAYIERCYGLHGIDALMLNAVSELTAALDQIDKDRERNKKNGRAGGRKSTSQDEICRSLERAIKKHGITRMMDQPISWIVTRILVDWTAEHGVHSDQPADNTIRRVIEKFLPDHPKVKKKICKKLAS